LGSIAHPFVCERLLPAIGLLGVLQFQSDQDTGTMTIPYAGVWPVAPTPFSDTGALDMAGQERILDCMIDQGVDGICILANYSEQFLLSDDERDKLMRLSLKHVAGRVPVIVTCSHFSSQIVVERCQLAADLGAAMIMLMPPYHGALLRASEAGTQDQFARAGEAGLPIMVQDAPLSGVDLTVPFLVKMAREIEQVAYFKIETPQAAAKLRKLVEMGGGFIDGPFDGEEAITLMADLDAGATGTMPSALLPDLIKPVVEAHRNGQRDTAAAEYARILPLINFENRQCGLRACKTVMMEGGVIKSDHVRHPLSPLDPATREGLLKLARELDPMALRWGR
jgi:4-hydroxy-tetrahydrodipicolinate synthase